MATNWEFERTYSYKKTAPRSVQDRWLSDANRYFDQWLQQGGPEGSRSVPRDNEGGQIAYIWTKQYTGEYNIQKSAEVIPESEGTKKLREAEEAVTAGEKAISDLTIELAKAAEAREVERQRELTARRDEISRQTALREKERVDAANLVRDDQLTRLQERHRESSAQARALAFSGGVRGGSSVEILKELGLEQQKQVEWLQGTEGGTTEKKFVEAESGLGRTRHSRALSDLFGKVTESGKTLWG